MARDEEINTGLGDPANDETAVLDLLDREMTAVQSHRKETHQSFELYALVSDLLKQVLIETDIPPSAQTEAFDEAATLLMEFPPVEKEIF
jgi:hypothetical protein